MDETVKYLDVYPQYTVDITTIKLRKSTKTSLEKLRTSKESYDDVVKRLIARSIQKIMVEELRYGYQTTSVSTKDMVKLWEGTTAEHE